MKFGLNTVNDRKRIHDGGHLREVHGVPGSAIVFVQCLVVSDRLASKALFVNNVGRIGLVNDSILVARGSSRCISSVEQLGLFADRCEWVQLVVDNDGNGLVAGLERNDIVSDVGGSSSD